MGSPHCFRFHLAQEGLLIPPPQANAIASTVHSFDVNPGIVSLLVRTLLITSDTSLVGTQWGDLLVLRKHKMGRGGASSRDAHMLRFVKMGGASLDCSVCL